jgi:hypothetical protein
MNTHLETILAILEDITPGADRALIYYNIGRAMQTAKLGLGLPRPPDEPAVEPVPVENDRGEPR